MRSRAIFLAGVLVVAGLLAGVTAGSVAAATSTTVTWKVSSLTAGQVKSLSDVATSNSPGAKTWSKTGSCTLTPKSKPTKLTMGTGTCKLKLKIARSGNFPIKTSSQTIKLKQETVSQRNARGMAEEYLDVLSFSRSGLIDQLLYEGFTQADAEYGVDSIKANWNQQAARSAQEYLDYMSFSRSGLIDQLLYEGFTRAQAEYGVDAVGF